MGAFFKKHRSALLRVLSVLLALGVWQLAAMVVKQRLFLASPASVALKLVELSGSAGFYSAVGRTLLSVLAGFFAAALAGSALGALSHRFEAAQVLLRPYVGLMKATPVASFIILALILVGSRYIAALISFLMVFPVFYSNILEGLASVERERVEAAEVFGMARSDRFRFIYLPYILPHLAAASGVGLGMAWKSGVAAEVIGLTVGSVGEKLYEAKLYLDTDELFAYTLVVVTLSFALEKLIKLALNALGRALLRDR